MDHGELCPASAAQGSNVPGLTCLRPIEVIKETRKGLTYTQELLIQKATRLAEIRAAQAELARMERRLQEEQDGLVRMIGAHGNITQFPTPEQRPYIKQFEKALKSGDLDRIGFTYDFCRDCGAHRTSWRDENGDYMEVAYARAVARFQGEAS